VPAAGAASSPGDDSSSNQKDQIVQEGLTITMVEGRANVQRQAPG